MKKKMDAIGNPIYPVIGGKYTFFIINKKY